LGEILYFMRLHINNSVKPKPVAMVSFYGPPHPGLLVASSQTYWTVQHLRDSALRVMDVKAIKSTVMLAP
ncbi:hypothetical protein C8J57DRAFT_998333, partial [Mycena rebaudengoi]